MLNYPENRIVQTEGNREVERTVCLKFSEEMMSWKDENSMLEYKVIVHIDEINKWELLLGNVNNLLNGIDNE